MDNFLNVNYCENAITVLYAVFTYTCSAFSENYHNNHKDKIIKTRIVRESDYSPASQLFCRVKKTMTGNYHKLDLVNIDAHTKFGLIMSIRSQDIERKRKSDLNIGP